MHRLTLVFAWPMLLAVIACGPRYQSPCSPRPGFDQVVRPHTHADGGPDTIYLTPPRNRAELPSTLAAVAEALRSAHGDRPVDVHVDIPLALLEGLPCEQLLQPFDRASACTATTRAAIIPFYYLPATRLGGGRELSLHFDEDGLCDGARWRATQ